MKFELLLTIFFTIVVLGESTKCYICQDDINSQEKSCSYPFNPDGMSKCDGSSCFIKEGILKIGAETKSVTQRGCMDSSSSYNLLTKKQALSKMIEQNYVCHTDLCNDATQKKSIKPFIILTIIAVLYLAL